MGIIRLLLAVSVVIWHSSPLFGLTMIGGPNAVELFFVISGFFMALILEGKYQKTNDPFRNFITNRLLKIFPVYWICLIASIVVGILGIMLFKNPLMFKPYIDYAGKMNFFSLFYLGFSNVFIIGQDIMLYLGLNTASNHLFFIRSYTLSTPQVTNFFPVGQAWSISMELVFYLFAPFLTKLKTKTILLMVILSIAARVLFIYQGFNYDPWNYRFLPLEISFFLIGILSYRVYKRARTISHIKLLGIGALFTAIISLFVFQFAFPGMNLDIKRWILDAVSIPTLPFVFSLLKESKIDRILGDLSYPIYLSHNIFIYLISTLFGYRGGYLSVLVIIFSVLFSLLLIKKIINPIDKIRQARLSYGENPRKKLALEYADNNRT